jgi:hypothetical protein
LLAAPRFLILALLAGTAACPGAAWAAPLPPAGEVALNAFFDGCLQPVSARKDPGPPMVLALASYKADEATKLDAQHPITGCGGCGPWTAIWNSRPSRARPGARSG